MGKIKSYFVEIDENLNILNSSESFHAYIGQSSVKNLDMIVPPVDLDGLRDAVLALEPGQSSLSCFRVRDNDGALSWFAATMEKHVNPDKNIKVALSDVQSMKNDVEQECYDKMTGVYSKSAIIEYAQNLMKKSPPVNFYFFLMDIDNFKSVNDTLGHMTGDDVIIEVAKIAKKHLGDKGVVGRIGGDEFMLVLEKVNQEPELREILMEIRYEIREKYMDEQGNKTVTASMGGALFPDYAKDYDSMFQLSDKMLYLAKTKGRDRHIIYTPHIHGKVLYDGKVMTIAQHMLINNQKSDMIMELMDKFMMKRTISLNMALEKILVTYNLDEIYFLGEDSFTSFFGLKKITDDAGVNSFESDSLDLSATVPEDFHPMFNTYPLKVVNMFHLQRENYPKFSTFMVDNGFRVLVVYHMTLKQQGGYIIFASNTNSSCRLAETDFADLTYFSRMVELSGRCP